MNTTEQTRTINPSQAASSATQAGAGVGRRAGLEGSTGFRGRGSGRTRLLRRNPKSEARNPKQYRIPKKKYRSGACRFRRAAVRHFLFSVSELVSDFVLRAPDSRERAVLRISGAAGLRRPGRGPRLCALQHLLVDALQRLVSEGQVGVGLEGDRVEDAGFEAPPDALALEDVDAHLLAVGLVLGELP